METLFQRMNSSSVGGFNAPASGGANFNQPSVMNMGMDSTQAQVKLILRQVRFVCEYSSVCWITQQAYALVLYKHLYSVSIICGTLQAYVVVLEYAGVLHKCML